jgi:hypothetical protein
MGTMLYLRCMKYLFASVLVLILTASCSQKDTKVIPYEVNFYEVYMPDEISVEWSHAEIVWRALMEQNNERADSTFEGMTEWNLLSQLVVPAGNYMIGLVAPEDQAKVDSILSLKEVKAVFPDDLKFAWSAFPYLEESDGKRFYLLYALKIQKGKRNLISGQDIEQVDGGKELFDSETFVDFTFKRNSATKWTELTEGNINRCIAVTINDKVLSAPRVANAIHSGDVRITGDFSAAEAESIAAGIRLRYGL